MIDGVKIECAGIKPEQWTNNPYLSFNTVVSSKTGKPINNNHVAKYKGLKFFIKPSTLHAGKYHFIIQGSLHKYKNAGDHNADDFTLLELKEVIKELQDKFHINPKQAYLRGFEYGVNIHPPITTKELLKSLVSYKSYEFSALKIDGHQNGKQIKRQRTQVKIYDKARQYERPDNNLTRFEVSIKKMDFIKHTGIKTLADLTDIAKYEPLKRLLLTFWDNVIYYDKKVNFRQLTNFEQKKLLYYVAPRNWTDFNRLQRHRAKRHFNEIMSKAGTDNIKAKIRNLLSQKQDAQITGIYAQNTPQKNEIDSRKMITFEPLKYKVKTLSFSKTNKRIKESYIFAENPPKFNVVFKTYKNAGKCIVCGKDISHKKAGALYCSKTCNNKLNGIRRTHHRQQSRRNEIERLNALLQDISTSNYWLTVKYKTGGAIYGDYLHKSEIMTTSDIIRQVYEIDIHTGSDDKHSPPPQEHPPEAMTGTHAPEHAPQVSNEVVKLTKQRARYFIKLLNDYNLKTNLKPKKYD